MRAQLLILAMFASVVYSRAFAAARSARIGFAYWDVGRMYDTIPSRLYDDKEFTPRGSRQWSMERYTHKIENIARVIDSLRMPIVALFGIETEGVTRQIVTALDEDYCYLHSTTEGSSGLDFALLYYGDILFVDRVVADYRSVYIEAEILSQRISITLWNRGYSSMLSSPPRTNNPTDVTIVAGALSHSNLESVSLKDTATPHEAVGRGNAMSYRGWYMRHRIGVNREVLVERSGVYIQPWMLTRNRTAPSPTFSKSGYVGGYSSYLPVFIYFVIECDGCDIE